MNTQMSILLLGASGHLGQCLQHTAPRTVKVVPLNSQGLDLRGGLLVQIQLEQLLSRHQIKYVINAAGFTRVDDAQNAPDEAFAVNAEGVYHLARACAAAKVPMLHFSTDYVFDGAKGAPYEVQDIPRPLNVYGQSKLAGERAVQRHLPWHWIFRVSWLYGPYGQNFGRQLIENARQGRPIYMVRDQVGSPTDSMHLARVVWQTVLSTSRLSWGLYHFCTRAPCTRLNYARQLLQAAYQQGVLARLPTVTAVRSEDFPAAALRPRYSALRSSPELEAVQGPAQQPLTGLGLTC